MLSWSGTGWTQTLSLDNLSLQPFLPEGAYSVSYTADGTRMTFIEGTTVMVAYGDGSNARMVPTPPLHSAAQPSLSPDGTHVVFVGDGGHLYVATVGSVSGEVHQITGAAQVDESPAWSPRGDVIAFTKQFGGQFAIGVINPDGSGERILTSGFHNEGPTFAPNGRVLMFFRDPGGNGGPALYTIDLTGRNEQKVPTPSYASDPAWSPLLS